MISMRLRRVSTAVVFDRQGPGFAPGNAGFNTLLLQGIPEPVGVISTVGQHPLRLGQIIEQGSCAGIISYLTGGYEEAERSTIRIGESMQLRVHAALGAPD